MTTYEPQTSGNDGIAYKVSYADIAGSFAGWFLLVVQGDNLTEDSDFNPANGPNLTSYQVTSPPSATRTLIITQINARLDRMLGAGHSAKWQATLVQAVTAASIDDNWPA